MYVDAYCFCWNSEYAFLQITSFQIIEFSLFSNKKLSFLCTQFDNKSGFKRSIQKWWTFQIEFQQNFLICTTYSSLKGFNLLSWCICTLSKSCFLVCPIEHYASLTLHFVIFCGILQFACQIKSHAVSCT